MADVRIEEQGEEAPAEPAAAAPQGSYLLLCAPEEREAATKDVLPLFEGYALEVIEWRPGTEVSPGEADTVVTFLGDGELSELLPLAAERGWRLALLPHPRLVQASAGLGLARKLEEGVEDLLAAKKDVRIDLLTCNGRVVLRSVVIGDTSALAQVGSPGAGLASRLLARLPRLRGLGSLRLRPFRITTQREKSLETAALGIVIVEHGHSTPLARWIRNESPPDDGQLCALVLAPRSVLQLARFLLSSAFSPAPRSGDLPAFVGLVKTSSLRVESPEPLEFTHDDAAVCARTIELVVAPRALRLVPGRNLAPPQSGANPKERFRTAELPVGEAREALVHKHLPWLPRAGAEDFKELYSALRANAAPSASYLTLMVLSTLLAALGLFANSAPVIIGAMILAPLMAPIVSLAMAVVRQDARLLVQCLRTLALGLFLAIGFAVLVTLVTPLQSINSEIAARLKPTLLDLGVAVISGVAGAYAHAREEVARSLAGVAIAVALVPPLAVAGIGLGWGSWVVFSGASLLFLTNLAGIVLAASLTFLLLGFAPFRLARRGLALSLVVVTLVGVPLALSFVHMVEEHRVIQRLDGWQVDGVAVREVVLRPGDPLHVAVKLVASAPLDDAVLARVKASIEERLGRPVVLEVLVAVVR